MAFSFVQGPTTGAPTNTTITGTVAGNFLVVCVDSEAINPASPSTFTGLEVNSGVGTQLTWTEAISANGNFAVFGVTYRHSWWFSSAIPGGIAGNIQVRVTGGVGAVINIFEISCADSGIHLDAANSGSAAATVNPSITLATTEDNGMIFSIITSSHVHPTAGAGFTTLAVPNSTSFMEGEYDADHGPAGSISVLWTATSTTYLITAFSLQEGAPPVPPQPHVMIIN
jgi:hypothetical protein